MKKGLLFIVATSFSASLLGMNGNTPSIQTNSENLPPAPTLMENIPLRSTTNQQSKKCNYKKCLFQSCCVAACPVALSIDTALMPLNVLTIFCAVGCCGGPVRKDPPCPSAINPVCGYIDGTNKEEICCIDPKSFEE